MKTMKKIAVGMLVCVAASVAMTDVAWARQGRGADDGAGHVRQGRGADDGAGHVRQGRGADDGANHR
jgi:hypothetical protein